MAKSLWLSSNDPCNIYIYFEDPPYIKATQQNVKTASDYITM